MRATVIASLAASAAVLAGAAALLAVGAGGPDFGQHVAACARADLGKRPAPPAMICTMPDGSTMTFANFGGMVRHMHEMGS